MSGAAAVRTSGVAYMLRKACFSVYLARFLSWDLQGKPAFTLAPDRWRGSLHY